MRSNNRTGTIDDNIINTYINYISENQRLYRYIVENTDNNERFLTTLLKDRLNNRNRNRSQTNSYNSYNSTRNIPRYFHPRHNIDRSYINNDRNNMLWSTIPNPGQHFTFPFTPNSNFMTPVTIRPTTEEINNYTNVMPYNTLSSDVRESVGNYCIITACDLSGSNVMIINQCGHYFSENGLRRHFENSVRCPICRFDIRDSNNDDEIEPPTADISANTFNGDDSDISNNLSGVRDEMLERLRELFNIPLNGDINSDVEFDVSNNNISLSYSFYTGGI
tara:strand:+ start:1757 stop:2590 length:834 start_codon:yes stop_codon:yes gene_type:complete